MRGSELPVLERVAGTIFRYNMMAPGDRVGVAVSGGADSVFLLHALHSLTARLGITVHVIHLNHKLRGKESDGDERFVHDLARELSLPCTSEAVAVADAGGNLEQAARDARRALFTRLIGEGRVGKVATGHTQSDQAETVLFRILRGAATTGLRGILPVTAEGLVRPLLDCHRHEIETWLEARGYHWREDRTNRDPHFVRNRIRHTLLPLLEREVNHSVRSNLAHLAQVAQDEELYWAGEMAGLLAKLLVRDSGGATMDASAVSGLPPAVARRLIRAALAEVRGSTRGLEFKHIQAVLDLAVRREGHGRVDLPGASVTRSHDWLRLVAANRRPLASFCLPLPVPGAVKLPGSTALLAERADFSNSYNEEFEAVDADLIPSGLEVRSWRPGDRIGTQQGRERKLKDLFQKERIPNWDRWGWPVITSGDAVVWTRRWGTSAAFRPNARTRHVIRFREEFAGGESNPKK